MPDEYRSWSKNPSISSDNGTPDWRIFFEFSKWCKRVELRSCEYWTKEILFLFVNSFQSRNGIRQSFEVPQCFKKKYKSFCCNIHQLSFTFFDYVRFIRVSWPKIFVRVIEDMDFSAINLWSAFFLLYSDWQNTQIWFSTMSLIPSLSCQQNSSASLNESFATWWFLRRNCLFKQNICGVVSTQNILFTNLQISWKFV